MKIALIGYGKMGKTIEQIAIQRGHQIVSIIDINNAEDIYSEAFKSADAAIEFTTPATAFNNYMKCFEAVSYTHLTLPTINLRCRSRWSPYH